MAGETLNVKGQRFPARHRSSTTAAHHSQRAAPYPRDRAQEATELAPGATAWHSIAVANARMPPMALGTVPTSGESLMPAVLRRVRAVSSNRRISERRILEAL